MPLLRREMQINVAPAHAGKSDCSPACRAEMLNAKGSLDTTNDDLARANEEIARLIAEVTGAWHLAVRRARTTRHLPTSLAPHVRARVTHTCHSSTHHVARGTRNFRCDVPTISPFEDMM